MVRLQTDPETRAYAERRTTEGKSRREIIRCLKRFIARDVFTLLTNPQPAIDTTGLRLQRERAGLSLQAVADALGTWPTTLSRIERGLTPTHAIVPTYRDWLAALSHAA